MKDELCQAVSKDLGKGEFYAYITEVHLIRTEIQHSIDHLKKWMKVTEVDTPIMTAPGKSYI
jgi:aldehyde dehydrogenase (NAD+)